MRTPIRIVLADDHAVLRAGLKSLLSAERDFDVVGEAGNGIECVALAADMEPDVIVLDINMPVCGGLDALPAIRQCAPDCKVLVLTMHDDPGYLRTVLKAGGSGFLLKQAAADELLSAIRVVADGGLYVSPRHARVLLDQAAADTARREPNDEKHARYRSLSDREAEIFKLTALGHSNAEMAAMLSLSVKTVETYKARMMRKLGLNGRASLVRLALELDLLR
ncbi:MAG: response regulator transcription factor [Acidimicrobiia bacterium]